MSFPCDALVEQSSWQNMSQENFCKSFFVCKESIKGIFGNFGKSIIGRCKDSERSSSSKSFCKPSSTNSSNVTSREWIYDICHHVDDTIIGFYVSLLHTLAINRHKTLKIQNILLNN